MRKLMVAFIMILVVLLPLFVYAADEKLTSFSDVPSLDLGIGFTANPNTFLVGGKFDYPLLYGFSIGPLVQGGFSSDVTLFGLSGNIKYNVSIPHEPRFMPSLEVGGGWLLTDNNNTNNTDNAFMLVFGVGLDYMVTDHIGLGGHVYASPIFGGDKDFLLSVLFGPRLNL